jgi:hypothetical protein
MNPRAGFANRQAPEQNDSACGIGRCAQTDRLVQYQIKLTNRLWQNR